MKGEKEGEGELFDGGLFRSFSFAPTLTQRIAWRTWRGVECPGPMSSKSTTSSCLLLLAILKTWEELREKGRKMRPKMKEREYERE